MRSETCNFAGCGQEVRWGTRHGRLAWWHREDVSHHVVLGNPSAPMSLSASVEEEQEDHVIEPVEVRAIPMPDRGRIFIGFRSGPPAVAVVQGGVRTVLNLAAKVGWEVTRLTYARGPYLGANGKSLGVSDSVVLHLRGPKVDERQVRAVGSWRDGGSDTAYLLRDHETTALGVNDLKGFMKEHPA